MFLAHHRGSFQIPVKSDEADCGVIPIDDPDHGLANQTLDQLAETRSFDLFSRSLSQEWMRNRPIRRRVFSCWARMPIRRVGQ